MLRSPLIARAILMPLLAAAALSSGMREYSVNPRRIALLGESAGGHLAALVGARDGRRLGLRAVVPSIRPAISRRWP